jgi:ABC-2 type transport system ATP-binding protein
LKKIVSIQNLTKSFGRRKAVNDLSFDVHKGEIFAFLGTNGAGKTTTLRCLLDIYRPDSGTLLINGEPYTHKQSRFIGYLPEERGIYTRAKVRELFQLFANLRGIDSERAKKLSTAYLKRVELEEHADKVITQLSSGMQQKVQLGLAFLHEPELLILDEPFKGLDPLNRQLFIDILQEKREKGTTILYSTHIIDDAQKLTDRLVIIKDGERRAYGKVNDVRAANGSKNLHVEFNGRFPADRKLFKAKITANTAELDPAKGVEPGAILKFLVGQKLELISYRLDYPSLNQVFIELTKN